MPFEVPREVFLIVEADHCGDLGRAHSVQEEPSRRFDPLADQV